MAIVTPFELTEPFSTDTFNLRISAINTNILKSATKELYGLDESSGPDDAFALIKTLIDNANANADTKAKAIAGTYNGTGNYGAGSPNTLYFPFMPKLLIVGGHGALEFIICSPCKLTSDYIPIVSGHSGYQVSAKMDGNRIYWYSDKDAHDQLNQTGTAYPYFYVAIS